MLAGAKVSWSVSERAADVRNGWETDTMAQRGSGSVLLYVPPHPLVHRVLVGGSTFLPLVNVLVHPLHALFRRFDGTLLSHLGLRIKSSLRATAPFETERQCPQWVESGH